MPPRCSQLPMWMCETCDERACRPVIFSSTVTWLADGLTKIVPLAVTPAPAAASLNVGPAGDGVGDSTAPADTAWLAEGVGVDAVSPPHATVITIAMGAMAQIVLADVIAASHRVPGTTAEGYWSVPRLKSRHASFLPVYAFRAAGAGATRRRRQTRYPTPARIRIGATAPTPVTT